MYKNEAKAKQNACQNKSTFAGLITPGRAQLAATALASVTCGVEM